ncbi:hypothetical protein PanWU01x14_051660 [Parasponia andersonii]|uniref:Retrovirus-related Pol polyprotein from transposon TNT 1-94-like beta-barrel domain-containing protein n=1 Tax=Parasponia andersonii TaxID=3476 RepID=A0A2P5DM36_PARAD|nr:hypothetical protein PanWU01x14_051660 [Parasponia andersonii]
MQKDCRFKNMQHAGAAIEKEGETNLFYAHQHTFESINEVCLASGSCSNDGETKWSLDSGCTNHMTANKNIFLDIDSAATSKVILGNGSLVDVKGNGTIGVQTKKGSRCI